MTNTIFSILMVFSMFGQLAAQTFEKKISIPLAGNTIKDIVIEQRLETTLLVRHSNVRADSLDFGSRPILFRVDSAGNLTDSIFYKASNFGTQYIDDINHIGMDFIFKEDGVFNMLGTVRSSLPLHFSLLRASLDSMLQISSSFQYFSLKDTFPAIYNYTLSEENRYLSGGDLDYNQGVFYGALTVINKDSAAVHNTLFDDSMRYWLGTVYETLIDVEQNLYTISDAYSGPPQYTVKGLQINKLDSSLNLLKKENCSIPTQTTFELPYLFNGDYNALWVNDTSFLVASAISNDIYNDKGDIHLMIYDTSLRRIAYKRIQSPDTNQISFSNCLSYDSSSEAFYFGVTQGLHEFTNNNPFQNELQTSFRLFKLDKNLNIIWDRSYYNEATIRLEHVVADSRGNVTMAGTYEDSATRANGYERHLYILRVDSMGNFNPVGIADVEKIPSRNFLFYPNPLSDQLTARRFNQQANYQLRFYDFKGRLIEKRSWNKDQIEINTTSWPSGLIVYKLEDEEGRRASGKLIKQ